MRLQSKRSNLIDSWVVDDLVGEPQLLLWELLPRLVGDLHSPLHSPTEPIRVRQLHSHIPPRMLEVILFQRLHQIT
jgi:hypothetical protein